MLSPAKLQSSDLILHVVNGARLKNKSSSVMVMPSSPWPFFWLEFLSGAA